MPATRCPPKMPIRPIRASAVIGLMGLTAVAATGQISASSWWPKFQHDASNSGSAAVMGIVRQAHVSWTVRISDPIDTVLYTSPVFSEDNRRLYVGGEGSILTAVGIARGQVAWTVALGDGSGFIDQTPTVAEGGAIYVGSWDLTAPYDGFSKVLDEGASARIVWTYPMQSLLASATITPAGLIIVAGRHATLGWGVFALRDLGETFEEVWTVPTTPQGGTPAVSADGLWVYVGSDRERDPPVPPAFWQIDASDGSVHESLLLDAYVWAASPTISSDGHVFIGEGMDFFNPDPLTEGKLYVFVTGVDDRIEELCSLPLDAGHLNGGIAAVRNTASGLTRLYVPANGFGSSGASLIAVEFDSAGVCDEPKSTMLRKVWSHSIGPKALTFPAAVITHDAVIYTAGPDDHTLYAVRDIGATPKQLWSLALADITRVDPWQPLDRRGHKEIIPGPDGMLYWLGVDGYLYAIKGWLTGDLNGDGKVNVSDLTWLKRLVPSALLDDPILLPLANHRILFPEIDAEIVGDIDGNGVLDAADVALLESFVVGP